jgi:sarcosine oxidase/sarcosine oxidase subunit beta
VSLAALGVHHRDIPLADVPDRFPMVETAGLTRGGRDRSRAACCPDPHPDRSGVALARDGVRFHADTRVVAVDPDTGPSTHRRERFSGDAVAWPPAPGSTSSSRAMPTAWCRPGRR